LAPLWAIQGRARVFVIKGAWRAAPWADALYGIDRHWWLASQGGKKFRGRKFSPSPTICRVYQDVTLIRLKSRAELLTGETGYVGCGLDQGGGYSGFQAANLAIQFGATRLILVGWDMHMTEGAHWADDKGVSPPDKGRMDSWRVAMDACAPQFERLGIEVLNASPSSALKAYSKVELEKLWR
jgi:hypothetical protein